MMERMFRLVNCGSFQAGISIVLRKKLREQSLFKFLHVLKPEVWLGILAAVFVTAILIWFLDRYSPYSARNNKYFDKFFQGTICH